MDAEIKRRLEETLKGLKEYIELPVCKKIVLCEIFEGDDLVPYDDTIEVAKVKSVIVVTKNLTGPHFEFATKGSLAKIKAGELNLELLKAEGKAEFSNTYAGVSAKVTAVQGEVGACSFNVGAGVSTGAGIKDDSVSMEVGGTGVTVGRKIGVSVLGTSVGIDLGKLF